MQTFHYFLILSFYLVHYKLNPGYTPIVFYYTKTDYWSL